MGSGSPKWTPPVPISKIRLDSWKEIAAYLDRDVRTVQRWERDLGLPVQRLPGGPKAGVFALRKDLDAWLETARVKPDRPFRRRVIVGACGALLLLLAAGAAGALAVLRNPRLLETADARFTPFATSLPVQVCPAWSPDGRSVAFLGQGADHARLFVQGIDSPSPVALTGNDVELADGADPTWCRSPFWSPDSQWLYLFTISGGSRAVSRVSAAGGPISLVQAGAIAATISPDGNTLAFMARSEDLKFRVWTATPPDGPRTRYEPEPYAVNGYADIPALRFAPDGKKIISVLTVGRETRFQLLPWPPGPAHIAFTPERAVGTPMLSWMPDSQHLVFAAGMLGMADTANGRYWPIAIHSERMWHPTASPDGRRVAYQSSLSHADVIAVPLAGGEIQTVLGSLRTEQGPAASPVGSQIVYITNKQKPQELWIKDTVAGWDRRLVSPKDIQVRGEPAQVLLAPEFSPDGRRVAFTAISPSAPAIFIVPAAGGIAVRATGGSAGETSPTWSPDGEWLAFRTWIDGNQTLVRARIGSAGAVQQLAPFCCSQSMPEWSPTGQWIAFPGESGAIHIIRADGGGGRLLGGRGTVAWSRDGRTLYRLDPAMRALVAVDVSSGRERVLRPLGDLLPYSGPQPGLRASVTPDNKSIVYSVLRPREEIWMMDGVRVDEPWYLRLLGIVPR
ncbi:MAG: PD40 domain-containing protein [Acidobacteria bacterium]|nr:PD40 domain-containing protein [Acidobacteriota bacterium]